MFKLIGDPIGAFFCVQFLGAADHADWLITKVYNILKDKNNKYLEFFVTNPTNQQQIQIYISPDRNPCASATQMFTKKLANMLISFHKGFDLRVGPSDGILADNNWTPIFWCTPSPNGPPLLEAHEPSIQHYKIKSDLIKAEFVKQTTRANADTVYERTSL